MWNLFRSKATCPVDPDAQGWVDERFRWLEAEFGRERLMGRVILPTEEFFPDPYEGRPEDAEAMLTRVAGYMGVDAGQLELVLFANQGVPQVGPGPRDTSGPAGLYMGGQWAESPGRTRIGVEVGQLNNPQALVATLAHEIGHELLLGQGRVSADQADHEPLTDLLTVFFGMGVFTGNSTLQDRGWSDGMWAGWQTKRLGYLDQRMFGYAMARYAWARGEHRPAWMGRVRPDVRAPMKQGLKFLAGGS